MVDEIIIVVQRKKHREESKINTLTYLKRDDVHTTKLMVRMAEHDNESNIAPITDAIKEDTGVEHESDNGEKTEKTETRGVDEEPSSLFQALEEQHE